jgi:hypothetical protein
VLDLFEETDCQSLSSLDPVRTATLPSAGGLASFAGLPVGIAFAVRASAYGPMNTLVASGCADGIAVNGSQNTNITVPFDDVPLRAGGSYTVQSHVDLGPTPAISAAQWIHDVTDFATMRGGDVAFVLSSIQSAVHANNPADDAVFTAALPHLTMSLASDLDLHGTHPVQVLTQLATQAAVVVQSPALQIGIDVAPASGPVTNVMSLTVRTASLTLDPLTPDVHVDDVVVQPITAGTGMIAVSGGDRAAVMLHGMNLPFPMIARAGEAALLGRLGVTSTRDWVRAEVSCAHVATLVVASTGSCDASCIVAGCQMALDQLAQRFDDSVSQTGVSHVQADLTFEGPAVGVAGSLRLASIGPAPLVGAYSDAASAVMTGTASMQAP